MEEYTMDPNTLVQGPEKLAKDLENIDCMEGADVYRILKTDYHVLFSNAIDNPCFDQLKRSDKFIYILTQVCDEADLTYEERVYCNSMLYHLLADDTVNEYMQKLYYTLGKCVNRNMLERFRRVGVDPILSTYLAIVRKSSFDQKDNVARLNFVITCTSPSVMTVQKIADIYCLIFDTVDEIKDLFFLTIRDTYIYNSGEDWITKDNLDTANNINFAVISILNSLSFDSLYKLLNEYCQLCIMEDLELNDVRFSLRSIDRDKFSNIAKVLDELDMNEIMIL